MCPFLARWPPPVEGPEAPIETSLLIVTCHWSLSLVQFYLLKDIWATMKIF